MNLKLETEFSKADILKEVDALKKQIDDMRPLPADVEGKIMQKLRLDWNYHSNAIEGNKLSFGETVAFLMEGITAKGKPLKDHLDIRGHNEAINFLLSIVKDTRPISEADIRALHKMILVEPYGVKAQTADGLPTTKRITLGEYKILPNHVQTATGETHYYATPEETPAKMQELMEWYNEVSNHPEIHPVVIAALFHHKFVSIHPFDDGNGRLSRILMNLILMQKGFPPVVIKMDDRRNYYALLSRADNGDGWPFIEYISERLSNSLQLYLKAAKGDDIDEDEDIDKEIALFRMELQSKVIPKKKAGKNDKNHIALEVVIPLIEILVRKLEVFDEFFERIIFDKEYREIASDDSVVESLKEQGLKMIGDIKTMVLTDNLTNSLSICVQLKNFKNPDNIFDVSEEINVELEDYEYWIDNPNGDIQIFKFYNERLVSSDYNKIVKAIINGLRYWINENTANTE